MKSGVPPWVLIAVAGITALATLLAAVISGLIAYRTSRRSIEHAAEMARLDREAATAAGHRSARRDAYAAYATAGMTSLRDISAARTEGMTSSRWQDTVSQAQSSIHALFVGFGVVRVEGPPHVAEAALNVFRALDDYRRVVVTRTSRELSEDGSEEIITVKVQPGKETEDASAAAVQAFNDFVAVAHATLTD